MPDALRPAVTEWRSCWARRFSTWHGIPMCPAGTPGLYRSLRKTGYDGDDAARSTSCVRMSTPMGTYVHIEPPSASLEALKVLVVDDDQDALEVVACASRRLGCACTIARDGLEGWKKFGGDRADIPISVGSRTPIP